MYEITQQVDISTYQAKAPSKKKWSKPSSIQDNTQSSNLVIQIGDDIYQQDWIADIDAYLKGKRTLRDRLIKRLLVADNSNNYLRTLFARIDYYRGADVCDPMIGVLSEAEDVLRRWMRSPRTDASNDAWYVVSHAIVMSSRLSLSEKFVHLRKILSSQNASLRYSAINALAVLAHNDELANKHVRAILQDVADGDIDIRLRSEAIDHLADIPQ